MKKVMFALSVLIAIMIVLFSDPLTAVAFVIYAVMEWLNLYRHSKNGHWIMAFAAIFVLLNIYLVSIPDVIFWALVAYAHKEVL